MAAIPRYRRTTGPALFSAGFRPFFLLGALWAALAILIWLPAFAGDYQIPTIFPPVTWHVHEMVFGYGAAVVAGFLLTAIPNWTGRIPLQGAPLAILLLLWAVGRLAVLLSAHFDAKKSRPSSISPFRRYSLASSPAKSSPDAIGATCRCWERSLCCLQATCLSISMLLALP
jgi:uncharacterized protein involved in response to NO